MKRLLPLALLLVVAVLVLTVWLLGGDRGQGSEAGPGDASPRGRGEATALAELEGEDAAEPGAAALRAPGADTSGARRAAGTREFDPALGWRLSGRVEIPPGTPGDEVLTITVVEAERAPSPLAEALEGDDDEDVLARAEVDPMGGFELLLPPDAGTAWVHLAGRYLRATRTVRVPAKGADEEVVVPTVLGGWVTGRLQLPGGAAPADLDVDAVEIELVPDRMAALGMGGVRREPLEQERRTHLRADLGFELGGVAAAVRLDVRARPEAFAAVKSERFELRPGEHREVVLRLERGGSLGGLVRDDKGAPVAGARVLAEIDPMMMGLGGWEVRRVESGEDGSYALRALPAGKLIVRTSKQGLLDGRAEVELGAGEARAGVDLELERGSSIAGALRWPDGAAVPGATVRAEFDPAQIGGMGALNALRGPRGSAVTDEQGRFVIGGLGLGPFVVRASAERDGEAWRVRVGDVAPETEDLELVLGVPVSLAGRVVDEAGQPVTRFRVSARTRTGGMIPGLGAETVAGSFEDEQGSFRLSGMFDGAWVVSAGGEGYGRGDELTVELPLEGEIQLRLPRASGIRGVVLGPEGSPVRGAVVEQEVGLQGLVARAEQGDAAPRAISDADGRFELGGLTPGAVSIAASSPGYARSAALPFDLAPAETVEGVVLELRRGGRILGEVFGSDGDPLPGVTIIAQQPSALTDQRFAASDGEGRFVFESLTPGSWQVLTMPGSGSLEELSGDDFAAFFTDMKMQMAEVLEGEDTHVVLGAPAADPVHVSGRVLVDGEPQGGVMVSFIPDGAAGMQSFKFTSAGPDGRFELDLDQPGDYLAQVQRISGAPGQQQNVQLRVEVPDEREFAVDLELPVARISGRVRGPDGQPMAGARVSLTVDGPVSNLTFMGGNYAEISTDDDGRYALEWLREGTYTIAAGGPALGGLFGDDGAGAAGRVVRDGVRVREGQHVEGVDFRLQEPGRIVGIVRDAGGRPVAEASVFLRDSEGHLMERISFVASDSAGRFSYSGVAPGTYEVVVRGRQQVSPQPAQVTVREGQDSSVELTVEPGTILLVMLSDNEGNPVDCEVTVLDSDGRQVNGSWSLADLMALAGSGSFSSKEQRIGPLPPGRYRVEASSSDGKSAAKPVVLSGQVERKLNLRLKD